MSKPFNLLQYMQRPPLQYPSPVDVEVVQMWKLEVKPQKIYIAASINAQLEAARLALDLQCAGFTVVSSWIRKDHAELSEKSKKSDVDRIEIQRQFCISDLMDLSQADTLIILTDVQSTSGGLHVELGYFIGADRRNVICVGRRLNVFFWARWIRFTPAVDGLVEWLQSPDHGRISKEETKDWIG